MTYADLIDYLLSHQTYLLTEGARYVHYTNRSL